MDNDIPELELSLKHCIEVGSPSVVISMATVHKYFSNPPHPSYPSTPCTDWDRLKNWAETKGWNVMLATEDTENGKQILPGIRFSPIKINPIPNAAHNPATNQAKEINAWYQKPIGSIGIGIVVTIISAIAIYLIRNHLGIPL